MPLEQLPPTIKDKRTKDYGKSPKGRVKVRIGLKGMNPFRNDWVICILIGSSTQDNESLRHWEEEGKKVGVFVTASPRYHRGESIANITLYKDSERGMRKNAVSNGILQYAAKEEEIAGLLGYIPNKRKNYIFYQPFVQNEIGNELKILFDPRASTKFQQKMEETMVNENGEIQEEEVKSGVEDFVSSSLHNDKATETEQPQESSMDLPPEERPESAFFEIGKGVPTIMEQQFQLAESRIMDEIEKIKECRKNQLRPLELELEAIRVCRETIKEHNSGRNG